MTAFDANWPSPKPWPPDPADMGIAIDVAADGQYAAALWALDSDGRIHIDLLATGQDEPR